MTFKSQLLRVDKIKNWEQTYRGCFCCGAKLHLSWVWVGVWKYKTMSVAPLKLSLPLIELVNACPSVIDCKSIENEALYYDMLFDLQLWNILDEKTFYLFVYPLNLPLTILGNKFDKQNKHTPLYCDSYTNHI